MLPIEKKHWFVVYTKPNSEKKTSLRLKQLGVETYCPTVKIIKQWSDRKKKIDTPVLPSMIFVHIEPSKRHIVFEISSVVRFLFWNQQAAVVRSQEIDELKASLDHKSGFKSYDIQPLEPGVEIDLTRQGFKNIKGTVKYIKDHKCWVIVKPLGYVIQLEINTH